MLLTIPDNTQELFGKLEQAANNLPADHRNAFALDLLKWAVDWQFSYLQFIEQQKQQQAQQAQAPAANGTPKPTLSSF